MCAAFFVYYILVYFITETFLLVYVESRECSYFNRDTDVEGSDRGRFEVI
jgi:hypothetical protein